MNKALTYRDNVASGITLEELQDDSDFSQLDPNKREFKTKVTNFIDKHLEPLKIIDEYLVERSARRL